MDRESFLNKLNSLPEVEPDAEDLAALERIKNDTSTETISHTDLVNEIECSGIISLRIPKSLHKELVRVAQDEGVSLDQYIMYKICH